MKRNKIIIIGLGDIGRELLKKISKEFEIVCVDLNKESGETASAIRSDSRIIIGDATSRLVLEEAGVADADAIIITTTTEEVNIEAARILKEHFESKRVISIGSTKTGIESLDSLGVEVENIFTASATSIRNKLELTARAPHAIGLGKNEILEVEVHPHSRLANRPLRSLTPIRWKIGIIYRDENIIVPRHDTVLKPKDRVIILGEPGVLKTVSEILTFRFQRFPLEYGSTIIAYAFGNEPDEYFSELGYLFSVFPLNRIIVLLSKKASSKTGHYEQGLRNENVRGLEMKAAPAPIFESIQQVIQEIRRDHGLITFWKDSFLGSFPGIRSGPAKKRLLSNILLDTDCPVMLLAGTHPYEKTVIPCVESVNLQHSFETALEIAASLNNEITSLLVTPSKYISSDDDMKKFEDMKRTISEVSLMYKTSIKKEILDGNPVKSVSKSLGDYKFLITDPENWGNQKWFLNFLSPDTIWYILRNSEISSLILPHVEEAL